MGNSESTCSPHEDGCKEAETKLKECRLAQLVPIAEEIATRVVTESYNAAFHDKYQYADYMKGGACKESYMTYVKSIDKDSDDKDSDDKHMTFMECAEAHSDYYHKFLDVYKGTQEQAIKEFKSIYPFRKDVGTPIRVQEFLGGWCKEQYLALFRCYLKEELSRGV